MVPLWDWLCLVAAGIFGYHEAVIATEYKAAVTFFNEDHVATEGMPRGDVIEIYWDIITGHFSDDKTVELLRNNVVGYEISQEDPCNKIRL